MQKILFVNACSGSQSRTKELANHLLGTLQGQVQELRLYEGDFRNLDSSDIEYRDSLLKSGKTDDDYFEAARQFAQADIIVVAAPYWDLLFPAVLRTYIENITVCGITFRYGENGIPQGLCKAKKLYYITTAGGYIGNNNFGYTYIENLSKNLLGIEETCFISAEGLDIYGADVDSIMSDAKKKITERPCKSPTIPYPEKYGDNPLKDGASSFAGAYDHPHSKYYAMNDYYNMKSEGSLHILGGFSTYQQTTEYTCGAACSLMVLNWFGKKKYHEIAVSHLVESHPCKGTTVENIADLFDLIGWNVDFHADTKCRFETVEETERFIIDNIDKGIPMMVDWVDWAGHWQVLIGIDTCGTDTPYDDVLIFADPYDVTDHYQDGYYTFSLGRFFGMWREGPCSEKSNPYKQPFVMAWPKPENENNIQ